MVVEHNDRERDGLLNGGDDLLRHHQVRPVADQHVHAAVGRRHFHAEAPGDLISHAGVAVLEVIALRIARAPQLVQIAGKTAGRAHDDVGRCECFLKSADHLRLREYTRLLSVDW